MSNVFFLLLFYYFLDHVYFKVSFLYNDYFVVALLALIQTLRYYYYTWCNHTDKPPQNPGLCFALSECGDCS